MLDREFVGLELSTNRVPELVRLPVRLRVDARSNTVTPAGIVKLLICCAKPWLMFIEPPEAAPLAAIVRVCPPCIT
jgi:hypothetical protein